MKRRWAALVAALLGASASAGSGCTTLYATSGPNLVALNSSYQPQQVAVSPATTLNGAALHPLTGELYYVDRAAATAPVLRRFNPVTRDDVVVGTLTPPSNINTTYNLVIGATFDNSSTSPRLFVSYGTYQTVEVNPATAATIRTILVNLPATDSSGATVAKRTMNSMVLTSGDLVFSGTSAYILVDAVRTVGGVSTGVVYLMNLGSLNTGTTATGALVGPVAYADGTLMVAGGVNGLAINPVTSQAIATGYVQGTTASSAAYVMAISTARLGAAGPASTYSDLSDCGLSPDAPALTKSFSQVSALTGSAVQLTVTLGNTNSAPYYTDQTVNDVFPAGLSVASAPGASTTCKTSSGAAPAFSPVAGATSITIPAAVAVPPGGCTFSVMVTGTRGLKNNVISAGQLVSLTGAAGSASASVRFQDRLVTGASSSLATVSKTQAACSSAVACGAPQSSVLNRLPGGRVEYCLKAVHPGDDYLAATSLTLRDPLNSALALDVAAYAGQGLKVTRVDSNGTQVSYLPILSAIPQQPSGQAWATGSPLTLSYQVPSFEAGVQVTACFQATVR